MAIRPSASASEDLWEALSPGVDAELTLVQSARFVEPMLNVAMSMVVQFVNVSQGTRVILTHPVLEVTVSLTLNATPTRPAKTIGVWTLVASPVALELTVQSRTMLPSVGVQGALPEIHSLTVASFHVMRFVQPVEPTRTVKLERKTDQSVDANKIILEIH